MSNTNFGIPHVLGDAAFATIGIGISLAIDRAFVPAGELSRIQRSDKVL